MKRILSFLALVLLAVPAFPANFGVGNGAPRTTNNDDTCDIAVAPAATLLLPNFEVDVDFPPDRSTIFSVTNVTKADQVVRVTLWTDYSFPVISFNMYLTGYDVQSINLFDVIVRGIIAPDEGTGNEVSPRGPLSDPDTIVEGQFCDRMPGSLDDFYVNRMQNAFLEGFVGPVGRLFPGCEDIGGVHEFATGYATIDVVGNCFFSQPNEDAYYTTDLRYDNVLTGEYQQINLAGQYAQMNPLVHIRAMPEGGTPESRQHGAHNRTNFPRTFYDRYAPEGYSDARQPLPSTFAARWRQGGFPNLQTSYKIWREGRTTGAGWLCADYDDNANLPVREVVVFDEAENFVAGTIDTPEMVVLAHNDAEMPQMTNGATGGWTYFNLDTTAGDGKATQNWVVVSMQGSGFGGDFDATVLGNGCTPETGVSEASQPGGVTIGPAANENP